MTRGPTTSLNVRLNADERHQLNTAAGQRAVPRAGRVVWVGTGTLQAHMARTGGMTGLSATHRSVNPLGVATNER